MHASNPEHSRRVFLRALGFTAAGLALGGGAAWAQGQAEAASAYENALSDLQARLAEAQASQSSLDLATADLRTLAETLRGQLSLATSQNAQLAEALAAAQRESLDLKTQLARAQAHLAARDDQLRRSSELNALYAQLEAVGLDEIVSGGLAALAGGLAAALRQSSAVQLGLKTARDLLAGFEAALPGVNAALQWLGDQTVALKLGLFSLERAAQTTASAALSGVVAVFGGFVSFVLKHLPFDAGQKSQATFAAAESVIGQTSALMREMDAQVFGQISRYVSDGERNWKKTLVRPIREQALGPADALLAAVAQADSTFQARLKAPADQALGRRADLRRQIADYRAAHGL